jgi:hypothetical protein
MQPSTDVSLSPFTTVYGRGLLQEMKNIACPKFVIVTMKDLWGKFATEVCTF